MDIREIVQDSQYHRRYRDLRDVVQKELPKIQSMFPYYTDHGIPHCDKLCELIGEILPDVFNPELTELEAFLLTSAILLHDIGMVPKDDEGPKEAIKRRIRENHHHRCREFILANRCNLGLDSKHAEIIADIAFAHRGRDAKDIAEYPDERTVGIGAEQRVRMQLLCALLRIADECHVTYDRVEKLIESKEQLDEESQRHFLKHLSTEGISCSPKGEVLEISATIAENEIREVLEGVREKIEYELDGVQSIFQRYGIGIRAVRIYLYESEQLQVENQGVLRHFVIKLLKNDSLQIPDFIKENKIDSADFQYLLDMLEEREIIVETRDDYMSLELDSDNLISVSRMFLDSDMNLDFLQLNTVQQAIEKTAASVIRDRFYIETDETTLKQILGFAMRFPSVLRFLFISDNSYYASAFEYTKRYTKLDLSNLTYSRFISEILTVALRELQTIDPGEIRELGEYTSTIEVSVTFRDHTSFTLANSVSMALIKAVGDLEAGQPVAAADLATELRFADYQVAQGCFLEAKKSYKAILERDSRSAPAMNNLGLVYKDLGHHRQAIALFDKIINELDPELPQVYLNKGTSLASLGMIDEAIESYEIAIQKRPDYFEAWYWKGVAFSGRGDFAGARDCFEHALHISSSSGAYFYLSKCLLGLGDPQGAMSNVDRAIKIDSAYIQARLWRTKLLRESGDLERALAELSELARISYECMVFHRRYKNAFDNAVDGYQKAADLKANILIEMDCYGKCNSFLDEVLFLIPKYANGWYNKACALAHLNRKAEMVESLKQSVLLEPSLKARAKEDRDFQDYWCDEDFKEIVQD